MGEDRVQRLVYETFKETCGRYFKNNEDNVDDAFAFFISTFNDRINKEDIEWAKNHLQEYIDEN